MEPGAERLDRSELARRLAATGPAAAALVSAHLEANDGDLLLHLLLPDVLRHVATSFAHGDEASARAVLDVVDRGLTHGDDDVRNAVEVSFVEHYGAFPGESDRLVLLWPASLRASLGR